MNILDIFLTLNLQHSIMHVKCPYVLLKYDFFKCLFSNQHYLYYDGAHIAYNAVLHMTK